MQITSIVKKQFSSMLRDLKFCFPAIVVGVQDLKDGFIDVQPVVNKQFEDMEMEEEALIYRVPVVFPSTSSSAMTFPIKQGDGVLIEICDVDIESYVNGLKETHDPLNYGLMVNENAVAHVGFNPYKESVLNTNNFKNQISLNDFNISHNRNTENEVVFSLTEDGKVKCTAPNGVEVYTNKAIVEAEEIDARSSLIKTQNDIEVKGISVYKHMTEHAHRYTDDGAPMMTDKPNNN